MPNKRPRTHPNASAEEACIVLATAAVAAVMAVLEARRAAFTKLHNKSTRWLLPSKLLSKQKAKSERPNSAVPNFSGTK